jgi:hypothetical protein
LWTRRRVYRLFVQTQAPRGIELYHGAGTRVESELIPPDLKNKHQTKNPSGEGFLKVFAIESDILGESYVNGVGAFSALLNFEGYVVIFLDLVNQARHVNEYVLIGTFNLNETESFGLIKKLYFTGLHYLLVIWVGNY